ncbi:MAG: hypothetical protein GY822_13760 [Deltaproteobacteria bacterium]|nr:hypothetical protein [Deltaproteobacteria bacterium]
MTLLEQAAPKHPPTDLKSFRQSFQYLTPNKRIEALLDCHDVIRVVRGLPIQDLYTTLREVGPQDALEVVELLHPRQVQGILDLDGWRGDRIDPESISNWLEILYAANADRAVQQIAFLDIEMLALLFKMHTRIYDMDEEGDVPELPDGDVGLHSITPDRRHVVVYDAGNAPEKMLIALKATVERLFGADLKFILGLIQAVRFDLPSILEEEALRWRRGRLCDMGFGDQEDAGILFAWLDPDAVLQGLEHPSDADVLNDDVDPLDPPRNLSTSVLLPNTLPADESEAHSFYHRALLSCDAKVREQVQHQLMMTVNQVHLVEGFDLGDPGALKDSLQRVVDTIGIALSYRSQGNLVDASALLASCPQATLFRIGFSLGLRLQRQLRRHLSQEGSGLSGSGVLRLDTPLREVAAGVLAKRPVFFRGLTSPARSDFRPFSSLDEVAMSASAVTEAAFRARLLQNACGVTDEALQKAGWDEEEAPPSQSSLFATFLLAQWLEKPLETKPLDDANLQEIVGRLRTNAPRGFSEADKARLGDVARAFAVSAFQQGGLPGSENENEAIERAQTFASLALSHVEDALVVVSDEHVDGNLVEGLWLQLLSAE